MSIDKKNITKGANEAVEGFEDYKIPDWIAELKAYDDEVGFVSPETTSKEAQGKINRFAEENIDSNVA